MKLPRSSQHRLIAAITVFAAIYGICLALFGVALGPWPPGAPWLWYVWVGLGAACLSAIAVELTMFGTWLWLKWTGFSASGGVPLRLSPADRRLLDRRRPQVAMLMPAHNEASTLQDRAALADRIHDILLKTPAYSTLFLLVDSPESQRENELSLIRQVKSRLRATGHEKHQARLVLEEYRDKPPMWRHKPGSILRWMQQYGEAYEYMFILDADSSLPEEDPDAPETCSVIDRMLLAMMRDKNLAIVQAAMHIRDYQTPWGWVQAINARVGTAYYLRVFAYLYGRATPCYGHNCLVRVVDFALCARNTLMFTSHDHIDASDLAAAGRGCVLSNAVLTYEEPEDSLLLWLKRECRWSRGNGQWAVYLLRKRGLPLGPIVYLTLGIAQYLWALLAGLFFVAAVAIVPVNQKLVVDPDITAASLLIASVAFALIVPKLLASPTLPGSASSLILTILLSPALMLYQGMFFVLGAFGSRWVPRGSRSNQLDLRQGVRIAGTLAPAMALGLLLWPLAQRHLLPQWGGMLMHGMIACMIVSPVTAVLVSWPRHSADGKGSSTSAP